MTETVAARSSDPTFNIREASREDIPQLEDLVDHFVTANRLLPRTFDELCDLIPFGFVAESNACIVGFAALEIYSAKLAEIRSLAVHEDHQGKGIGRALVQRCVELAVRATCWRLWPSRQLMAFSKHADSTLRCPGKKALFMQTRDEY